MKTLKKDLLCDQSLEEIRQELSQIELSEVPDEEYIALLTRHTSNLLELVEKLNLEVDSYEGIYSTFSFLFGNLSEPVCVINEDFKVLYHNNCWKTKYSDLRRKNVRDSFLNEANKEIIHQAIDICRKEGRSKIITLQLNETSYFISIMPFDGLDEGICFLLFSINEGFMEQIKVGKLSAAESSGKKESLSVSQFSDSHLLVALLNAIDGFHFTMDTDLKILQISSSAVKKLKIPVSEIINKPFTAFLSEKSKHEIKEIIKLELNTPSENLLQSYRGEIDIIDRNRNSKHYDLTLVFDKKNKVFAGVCADTQHYIKREHELLEAKMNAELNDKLKTDFLANMSHEIRTPLNGIVGFSTMLNRNHLDKIKREKYLRIIRTSTIQLLTLVNDIIDISKIEAGQLKMHFVKVDIHQILEDLQTTFQAEAQRLGKDKIKLVKQTGKPRSKIYFKCDEVRLKQILSNLLGNALKFTNEGEIIFGYSIEKDNTIRFFVKDSGLGVPENEQESIFSRYKQSSEGMKYKHRGTGLGLAISKGIVELMGGSIGIKSYAGTGSEFYFTLPLI